MVYVVGCVRGGGVCAYGHVVCMSVMVRVWGGGCLDVLRQTRSKDFPRPLFLGPHFLTPSSEASVAHLPSVGLAGGGGRRVGRRLGPSTDSKPFHFLSLRTSQISSPAQGGGSRGPLLTTHSPPFPFPQQGQSKASPLPSPSLLPPCPPQEGQALP